ncbi:MAG TPA: hypothetical protein VGC18_07515 [Lacisediminihabitans sp.]|uniref:hypothetical protein n=1 Tax=Lacisediminihabitans sp. TaxID=2787631 RepID=UPI002EDA7AF9
MIGALAQSAHPNHRWRWTSALLAAVFALLVAVAGAAPAAAISASGPRIAVGATVFAVAPLPAVTAAYTYNGATYTYEAPARLSSSDTVATGARWSPSGPGAVSWGRSASVRDRGDAANTGGSVLNFGSRAAAREGLPGDLAGAGNRFFRGATSKSQDFQAVELPGGGYRMQFSSPANNPGYSKVYVQEIDRAGQVLREYKNTMGPDGLIETKWVHGGP